MSQKESKKPFVYTTDTQKLINNIQRDYRLMTEKTETVTVAELTQAKGAHLMKLIYSFLEKCIKEEEGDFFILVKRHHEVTDRLMDRIRLKQALQLPTPLPGWSYWHYHSNKEELEFLFDIPPEKSCRWALKYKTVVGIEKPVVMKTIFDYYDGTLLRRINEINKQITQKGLS